MKILLMLVLVAVGTSSSYGQSTESSHLKTQNVVVVTLDGMRWQEVFRGIDPKNVSNPKFTPRPELILKHYRATSNQSSRERLMPFIWNTVVKQGQLYGNRRLHSEVDVTNPYRFSYPGYNELFTGFPDPAVNSNDNIPNPNDNVYEFINKQAGFKNEVAVFATWETIPYILNRDRSGLNINADDDEFTFGGPKAAELNRLQRTVARPLGVRPDRITFAGAEAYLELKHPKVLYISLGQTDEAAHMGKYDAYLNSAHEADRLISHLWTTLQSIDQYRDKTTLIITTDHGRGGWGKKNWVEHGDDDNGPILESSQIWMAFLGPDTSARGEISGGAHLFQKQMAQTIAHLLGLTYESPHGVAPYLEPIFSEGLH